MYAEKRKVTEAKQKASKAANMNIFMRSPVKFHLRKLRKPRQLNRLKRILNPKQMMMLKMKAVLILMNTGTLRKLESSY